MTIKPINIINKMEINMIIPFIETRSLGGPVWSVVLSGGALRKAIIERIIAATTQMATIQSWTAEKPMLRPRNSATPVSTVRSRGL